MFSGARSTSSYVARSRRSSSHTGTRLRASSGANGGAIDIDDLFLRSIELPHFNRQTRAIEGISLLPVESHRYREALRLYRDTFMPSEGPL